MEPSHTQGEPLWLTAYLFFEGHVYGEEADRVIREVVAPLARACRPDAVRWFFLRCAEEASHVRLRFLAPDPVLEETILSAFLRRRFRFPAPSQGRVRFTTTAPATTVETPQPLSTDLSVTTIGRGVSTSKGRYRLDLGKITPSTFHSR